MIRKWIVDWLVGGIREDLEAKARQVFMAALVKAFRDMKSETVSLDLLEGSGGLCVMSPSDMTAAVKATRRSIRDVVDTEASKHMAHLGGLRQGISELVEAQVTKESTIDTIIAKINSKQLKGGLPT